jgi:CRISPR/Cas system endoribonuclease Cas6 (RAMP superfamily)
MTKTPSDIASLLLHLQSTMNRTIPEELGRATYAFALDWIRSVNPELSAEIHDQQDQKIITTSGLMRGTETLLGEMIEGQSIWLQITGLREDVVKVLAQYYQELSQDPSSQPYWTIGSIPWRFVAVE